jgi:hypothetical protein
MRVRRVVFAQKPTRRRGRPAASDVPRPVCPLGHQGWAIQIKEAKPTAWGPYPRLRFRCVPPGYDTGIKKLRAAAKKDGPGAAALATWLGPPQHTFYAVPLPGRHPTHAHPDSGAACAECERTYARNEGPQAGRDFLFTIREISRTLSFAGQGVAYRRSGHSVRETALRAKTDPNAPAARARRERRLAQKLKVRKYRRRRILTATRYLEYSNESRLAASYIDNFAPIVIAAGPKYEQWPARVGLDTHALKGVLLDSTGKRTSGGRKMGEIICAMDLTVVPARIIKLELMGGKDHLSILDVLRSIPTVTPVELTVADRGSEIEKAVGIIWPDAYQYACEGHIKKNARDAAKLDGCYEWMPNPNKPTETVTIDPLAWGKRTPNLLLSPIWLAINSMQQSVESWEIFKAAVAAWPDEHKNLDSFITNAEQLVATRLCVVDLSRARSKVRTCPSLQARDQGPHLLSQAQVPVLLESPCLRRQQHRSPISQGRRGMASDQERRTPARRLPTRRERQGLVALFQVQAKARL